MTHAELHHLQDSLTFMQTWFFGGGLLTGWATAAMLVVGRRWLSRGR
jgi:predicted metal-binding membrane protein